MEELRQIESKIKQLAEQIDVPADLIPSFGAIRLDRPSCIESQGNAYYFIVTDGGREVKRKTTFSLDELFYFTFDNITFEMAIAYGREHYPEDVDFRRILFGHQLELLDKLNGQWKERRAIEIESILQLHPYNDK